MWSANMYYVETNGRIILGTNDKLLALRRAIERGGVVIVMEADNKCKK